MVFLHSSSRLGIHFEDKSPQMEIQSFYLPFTQPHTPYLTLA